MIRTESEAHAHVQAMQHRLEETINLLREDVGKVDEPRLKALFETSAEVLTGLKKAYVDYEEKKEPAWPGGKELHS